MDTPLIDRIYECSFVPELWPGVLDDLARISGARGGHFLVLSGGGVKWAASETLREGIASFVKSDARFRSRRFSVASRLGATGFIRTQDVYTPVEQATDPIYSEFLFPAGLGWAASTAMPLPTGEQLYVTVERDLVRGPVESAVIARLDAFRPHLARSAMIAARLHLERARAATETLGRLGLPALAFAAGGTVLAANHLIEAMTGPIWWRTQDRIALKDPAANAMFKQAVQTLHTGSATALRSFPLRDGDFNAVLVAHVIPVRGSAHDIFTGCTGLLVLTQVAAPQSPPVELIQLLFDLTAAEARVARGIAGGGTVEHIASTAGVSLNTVKTQLRGVLDKTGCSRQAEVVALLSGIALPRG